MSCSNCKSISYKSFEASWKFFVIILVPIILLFIPFIPIVSLKGSVTSKESTCLYVLTIMVCYWVLNALPLVVTALIPLAVIPLFGIYDGKDLAKNYMREPTMLVFGALMIACAFLASDLHKRMALKIMSITGNSTLRIVSTVYVSTLSLSMCITSVAASLIMVATCHSLIEQRQIVGEEDFVSARNSRTDIRERDESASTTVEVRQSGENDLVNTSSQFVDRAASEASASSADLREQTTVAESEQVETVKEVEPIKELEIAKEVVKLNIGERDIVDRKLKRQLLITIYVAANIGSLFLPHDTATANVLYDWADLRKNKFVMGKQIDTSMSLTLRKNNTRTELTTEKWTLYVLPTMVVLSATAWFYLVFIFTHLSPVIPETTRLFSFKKLEEKILLTREKEMYKENYVGLGKFTFHQIIVIILTVSLFLMWFFRDPRSFKGWATIIPNQGGTSVKVKAGYSAPAILIVTIMFMIPRFGTSSKSKDKTPALLGWKFLESQVLWNLLLLMGGCFAIAECIHRSGLSLILLKYYNEMAQSSSHNVVVLSCVTLSLFLSELCSGITSVCSIVQVFVVLSRFHATMGYVSLPVTVMSILSFMLPVATPSNALVFTAGAGDLKVLDMIKYGALLDAFSWLTVIIVDVAFGSLIFDRG